MFITKNKIRMHDTDMAGRLYFARQFRFAHDALEDYCSDKGFSFDDVFHQSKFVFVIVHCEADYLTLLKVGDDLEVRVFVEKVGNSSFTIYYEFYKTDKTLAGTAKTVHVTLDKESGKKIPIPANFRLILEKDYKFDSKGNI